MRIDEFNADDPVLVENGVRLGDLRLGDDVMHYSEISDLHDRFNLDVTLTPFGDLSVEQDVYAGTAEDLRRSLSGDVRYSGAVLDFTISSDLPETEGRNGTVITVAGSDASGIRYSDDALKTTRRSNCVSCWVKTIAAGRDAHGNVLVAMPYNGPAKLVSEDGAVESFPNSVLYSRDGATWKAGAKMKTGEKPFAQRFAIAASDDGLFFCTHDQCSDYIRVTRDPTSKAPVDADDPDVTAGWCRMQVSETPGQRHDSLAILTRGKFLYLVRGRQVDILELVSDAKAAFRRDLSTEYSVRGSSRLDNYTTDGVVSRVVDGVFYGLVSCQDGCLIAIRHDLSTDRLSAEAFCYRGGESPKPDFDTSSFHPKALAFHDGKFYLTLYNKDMFESSDAVAWTKIEFENDIRKLPETGDGFEGGLVSSGGQLYLVGNIICRLIPTATPARYVLATKGNIRLGLSGRVSAVRESSFPEIVSFDF